MRSRDLSHPLRLASRCLPRDFLHQRRGARQHRAPPGDTANEALAVSKAVAAANGNGVTVFAHHLTYQNRGPAVIANYNDLCNQTGGRALFQRQCRCRRISRDPRRGDLRRMRQAALRGGEDPQA
ncbi:MAG: hypothetical protein WDN24_21695 [Sphingomonas sp.]